MTSQWILNELAWMNSEIILKESCMHYCRILHEFWTTYGWSMNELWMKHWWVLKEFQTDYGWTLNELWMSSGRIWGTSEWILTEIIWMNYEGLLKEFLHKIVISSYKLKIQKQLQLEFLINSWSKILNNWFERGSQVENVLNRKWPSTERRNAPLTHWANFGWLIGLHE